jgi:phosphopantetheinyl transferase
MCTPGAVAPRIYLLSTDVEKDALEALFKALPPARAALAARLRETANFAASVLGFYLVRYALYAETGRVWSGDWLLAACGKPYLEGAPFFNLSHTAHAVAVAVCEQEVGVDIEEIKPHHQALAARICTADELARLNRAHDQVLELCRLWSEKEAEGKRLGTGIASPRSLSTHQVTSSTLSVCGVPHVLSLSPATEAPVPQWITPQQLFLSER